MHYMMIIILMLMAGCTTTGTSAIGQASIKKVETNNVVQSVTNTPTPPDWVLRSEHPGFINTQYLVGVGFSRENMVQASESARVELAKNIRFTIASVMKDYTSNSGTFVESFIKTEIDSLLEGVQIKDGWYDLQKNIYYSFAVVKRKYILNHVKDQIAGVENNLHLILQQADSYYKTGQFLKALVYYYNGLNESNKLMPLVRTYKSVSLFPELPPIGSGVPEPYEFKEKIQNIVDNIKIEKVKDSEGVIRTNNDVSFAVRLSVFEQALASVPIIFYGNSYNFVAKVKSDKNGICRIKTKSSNVISLHKEFAIVKAKIDIFTLAKQFNYRLTKNLFGHLETLNVSFKKIVQSNVKTWLNRDTFNPGERMIIFVETDEPGYVVLRTSINGKTYQIFPNHKAKDNYLHANKVYGIGDAGYDFKFYAKKPGGHGQVQVLIYNNKERDLLRSKTHFDYVIRE